MNTPRFIALEGMDGTGKSTLATALAAALDAAPLRTPLAALTEVRPVLDAVYAGSPVAAQLFYASTVVRASDEARALLRAGRSVVIDRYWASTLAYAACRDDAADLRELTPRLLVPDLTVYLHVDDDVRAERLAHRGMSAADHDSLAQRERLRAAYARALRDFPGRRLARVDTGHRSPAQCVSEVTRLVASLSRRAA